MKRSWMHDHQLVIPHHEHVARGPYRLLRHRDQRLRHVDLHEHVDKHAPQQRPRRLRWQRRHRRPVAVDGLHVGRLRHEHAAGERAGLLVETPPLLPGENAVPLIRPVAEREHHPRGRVGQIMGTKSVTIGHAASPDLRQFVHSQARLHFHGARVLERDQRRSPGHERVLLHLVVHHHAGDRCHHSRS